MILVPFNAEVDLFCQGWELLSSEENNTYCDYDPKNLCNSVVLQKGQAITATGSHMICPIVKVTVILW